MKTKSIGHEEKRIGQEDRHAKGSEMNKPQERVVGTDGEKREL